MTGSEPDDLVSTPAAAKAVGISAKTLQRYAKRKVVKPVRRLPGGHYRWRIPDLEAQMDAITEAANAADEEEDAEDADDDEATGEDDDGTP